MTLEKFQGAGKGAQCLILALSQLSRQVEAREGKRPHLSDLRDSGLIEQDADVVLFVFREAYYHSMGKPEDDKKLAAWSEGAEQIHNRAELIIAKHRHGPTDTVEMFFDPELTCFSSLGGATTASPWAVDLGCDIFEGQGREGYTR